MADLTPELVFLLVRVPFLLFLKAFALKYPKVVPIIGTR